MLCIRQQQPQCLEKLLYYGGISFCVKDKKERNIKELSEVYQNEEIKEILVQYEGKIEENGICLIKRKEINQEYEKSSAKQSKQQEQQNNGEQQMLDQSNKSSIDKYHNLLIFGDRIPCVICLTDDGYIKYTTCCGQPIHSLCKSEKLVKCPYCGKEGFGLTAEIVYPERALELPSDWQPDQDII